MIVTALFTENTGDPATGVTLSDIDIYLYSRAKADGVIATVWNGENPTEEIGGGLYSKATSSTDVDTYDYFAYAHYTGATPLDSDYSLQSDVAGNELGDIADAVCDEAIESTLTLRELMRGFLSVLAGLSSGGGTTNIKFRDLLDTKDRIDATVDADGNRIAITLDFS